MKMFEEIFTVGFKAAKREQGVQPTGGRARRAGGGEKKQNINGTHCTS